MILPSGSILPHSIPQNLDYETNINPNFGGAGGAPPGPGPGAGPGFCEVLFVLDSLLLVIDCVCVCSVLFGVVCFCLRLIVFVCFVCV